MTLKLIKIEKISRNSLFHDKSLSRSQVKEIYLKKIAATGFDFYYEFKTSKIQVISHEKLVEEK